MLPKNPVFLFGGRWAALFRLSEPTVDIEEDAVQLDFDGRRDFRRTMRAVGWMARPKGSERDRF
jgi:hypothetical protein